jgi:hypothetical protein
MKKRQASATALLSSRDLVLQLASKFDEKIPTTFSYSQSTKNHENQRVYNIYSTNEKKTNNLPLPVEVKQISLSPATLLHVPQGYSSTGNEMSSHHPLETNNQPRTQGLARIRSESQLLYMNEFA